MKCNTGLKWVEFQRENKLHIKGPINDIIKACYQSMIFKVDHFQAKTIWIDRWRANLSHMVSKDNSLVARRNI